MTHDDYDDECVLGVAGDTFFHAAIRKINPQKNAITLIKHPNEQEKDTISDACSNDKNAITINRTESTVFEELKKINDTLNQMKESMRDIDSKITSLLQNSGVTKNNNTKKRGKNQYEYEFDVSN